MQPDRLNHISNYRYMCGFGRVWGLEFCHPVFVRLFNIIHFIVESLELETKIHFQQG